MKPKDRLHDHMDCSGQVIAPSNVTRFVGENRFQLKRRQAFHDARRQEKDGAPQSDHTGFKQALSRSCLDR